MVTAEDSDKSRSDDCPLCGGSGVLSWEQPHFGVLRTIEMPCPAGCGEHWKHPLAEWDRVVAEAAESDDPIDLGLERVTVHSSYRAISMYCRHGFTASPRLLQARLSV